MGLCKDCKFYDVVAQRGRETRGVCTRVSDEAVAQPNEFAIQVIVADDHNLEYRLIVGPEFGCVLFEPK